MKRPTKSTIKIAIKSKLTPNLKLDSPSKKISPNPPLNNGSGI